MPHKRLILALPVVAGILATGYVLLLSGVFAASPAGVSSPDSSVSTVSPVGTDLTSTTTTTQTSAPIRKKVPRDVFIVGDSSIAGLRWIPSSQVALQGFNVTLDVESCRRLVQPNCNSREGRRVKNTLDTILNRTFGEADTLVVGAGYDDESSRLFDDFNLIVNAARSRGFSQIIWLTYRETTLYVRPDGTRVSDYGLMNQILRGKIASGEFDDVMIADLWKYTSTAPEWFVRDGIHYRLAGAFGVADFLSRTIAALDGLPCPQPWSSGGSVDTPCVRPESVVAARGQADLAGLYGI